jgi:hypothetical protein
MKETPMPAAPNPDREQFLARLSDAVDAYINRMQGRRPQGTKSWIADQLRIDRTTLYKYLDGTNQIPIDCLRNLIRLLGVGDDETNNLLFLGGYGVPIPVVSEPPLREPSITAADLRVALTEILPATLPAALHTALADHLSLFSGLLNDLRKGQLTRDDLEQALAAHPTLAELIRAFTGRQAQVKDTLIQFGDGVQTGDIYIRDTAGRDIVNITLQLTPPPPQIPTLHQLRAPVADFVGREQELAELTAALTAGTAATISGVAGMGGIGKTELAMKVANDLRERYPDAQVVLNLQGSRDTAMSAMTALQQVIRVFAPEAQLPDDEPKLVAAYCSLLADKRVLILADDAKDAAQVRPLLLSHEDPPTAQYSGCEGRRPGQAIAAPSRLGAACHQPSALHAPGYAAYRSGATGGS